MFLRSDDGVTPKKNTNLPPHLQRPDTHGLEERLRMLGGGTDVKASVRRALNVENVDNTVQNGAHGGLEERLKMLGGGDVKASVRRALGGSNDVSNKFFRNIVRG